MLYYIICVPIHKNFLVCLLFYVQAKEIRIYTKKLYIQIRNKDLYIVNFLCNNVFAHSQQTDFVLNYSTLNGRNTILQARN